MRSEREGVRPFSNGTEFSDWTERNCDRCVRRGPSDTGSECRLERALAVAYFGSGEVTVDVARLINRAGDDRESFVCGERVLRPEEQVKEDRRNALPEWSLVRSDGFEIARYRWTLAERRYLLREWSDTYRWCGMSVALRATPPDTGTPRETPE